MRGTTVHWIDTKMNKWVLDQIKPELSLETKMLKLRLSYFGYIIRKQDFLGRKPSNAWKD